MKLERMKSKVQVIGGIEMSLSIQTIDLGGVNCYLGSQEGNYMLIDTGGYMLLDKEFNDRRELLIKKLGEYGCTKDNLKLLVLTHGDCDHTANAAYLRQHYGLKIAMHRGDLKLVQNLEVQDLMASFNFKSLVIKVAMKLMEGKTKLVVKKTVEAFQKFTPDIFLEEGGSLKPYGFDAQVLHLPGHTPGSIGILTGENELVCGDLFQNNKKLEKGMNALDFELRDKSVERVKNMNVNALYVGHGTPWRNSYGK